MKGLKFILFLLNSRKSRNENNYKEGLLKCSDVLIRFLLLWNHKKVVKRYNWKYVNWGVIKWLKPFLF